MSLSSFLASFPSRLRRFLGSQRVEATHFETDLGLDVVQQGLEEHVLVKPVVVKPEGVVFLGGLEQPIDRGLAAALGVASDVIIQKPPLPGLRK